MSMRLVLSHYLESLRERDELDALLPDLLQAMGHSVHSRPQIGVAQGGIDVLSSFPSRGAHKEAFLFIVKFGNIGREDLYAGKQAIQPSVREACTDYIRTRLPHSLRDVRKRLVLLTNGIVKQEAQSGFAALTEEVDRTSTCSLEIWGSDQLIPLIEKHLFDESLLLSAGQYHLRSAIATLDDSDASIQRFVQFVDSALTDGSSSQTRSVAAKKRRFLKRCATAVMGWSVFATWAETEGNLKPSTDGCEYLALRMWAEAIKQGFIEDRKFGHRFRIVMAMLAGSLYKYVEKVAPQLLNTRLVLSYRSEWALYTKLVLEELGRLALLLLLVKKNAETVEIRRDIRRLLVDILNVHTGCRLPAMDGQSIDLSLVLVSLMSEEDWAGTSNLVTDIAARLRLAVQSKRHIPVDTDLLEDAITLHSGDGNVEDFFKTSSLIPMLATVASMIHDEQALTLLRDDLCPTIKNVTLERWYPKAALETLAETKENIQQLGISRALSELKRSCNEEASASVTIPQGAASAFDFKCVEFDCNVLIAISSRLYRHPLPTWYIEMFRRH
jgi:hypothetical protein